MTPVEESSIRPEFHPLSVLAALWKRKFLILAAWAAVVAGATVVILRLPEVYQARAVILIEQQRIPERFVASTVNEEVGSRLSRIRQLVLSYDRLLRLIDDFDLYRQNRGDKVQEELVAQLHEDIEVSVIPGWADKTVPAFQVAFSGRDPNVVAQVANRIAALFLKENLKSRSTQAMGTSEFLAAQLEEARRAVERQEELVRQYRERHAGALPDHETAILNELHGLQAEAESIDGAINRTHQSKLMLENALTSAESSLQLIAEMAKQEAEEAQRASEAVAFPGSTAPPPDSPRVALRRAEAELASALGRYGEDHPDIVRLKGYVARLRAEVETETPKKDPPSAIDSEPVEDEPGETELLAQSRFGQTVIKERERVSTLRAQLAAIERQMRLHDLKKAEVERKIAAAQARIEMIPANQQELQKVIRDYDISMENYRQLLAKRNEADLSAEMEIRQKAEKFTILDQARLPEKPISPDRPRLFGMAAAAGLALGCVLGFLIEWRNNVILGQWELPAHVTVLGQVPAIDLSRSTAVDSAKPEKRSAAGLSEPGRPRKALIASSLAISAAIIAGGGYWMGWISF